MTVVAEDLEVSIDDAIQQRLANVRDTHEAEDLIRDLFPEFVILVAQEIPLGANHEKKGHLEIQVIDLTQEYLDTQRYYVPR